MAKEADRRRAIWRRSRRRTRIIAFCTLLIVGAFIYFFVTTNLTADLAPPSLSMDWKTRLSILDARQNRNLTIPMGIGATPSLWANHTLDIYGPSGYSPLSTREPPAQDGTATIYIQSTRPRLYSIGDFFDIWGQRISASCVQISGQIDYCAGPGNPPPWISDGSREFCLDRNRILLDNGLTWLILVGTSVGFDSSQCT